MPNHSGSWFRRQLQRPSRWLWGPAQSPQCWDAALAPMAVLKMQGQADRIETGRMILLSSWPIAVQSPIGPPRDLEFPWTSRPPSRRPPPLRLARIAPGPAAGSLASPLVDNVAPSRSVVQMDERKTSTYTRDGSSTNRKTMESSIPRR